MTGAFAGGIPRLFGRKTQKLCGIGPSDLWWFQDGPSNL
jgi:hypothetical protein